jgi:branched-chain amino acid transport system ATP-binding protein
MSVDEGQTTAAGPRPLIEIRDLHVYRGEAHILQGVGFEVRPNQVTALLGRNGVGKTTTLLAILGLLEPRGEILFDGEEIAGKETHDLVRDLGIGYVPEDREVFSALTVRENLRLAERTKEAAERYRLVYDLFPILEERQQQPAGTLSGGQQQMLAVGRALLNPNRLLLIDEPTKGLAPIIITELVAALKSSLVDTTVLLVEQNLRVAEQLATDTIVLDEGRVVFTGAVDDLLGDPELTNRYLGVSTAGGAE